MIVRLVAASVVSMSLVLAGQAHGRGGEFTPEQLAARGPNAVHGYWINRMDYVLYKGDTAAFNEFLAKASKDRDVGPIVTIHEGTLEPRSRAPAPAGAKIADWSTTSFDRSPAVAEIDVWLDGRIEKDKIVWPEGIVPRSPMPNLDLPAQAK